MSVCYKLTDEHIWLSG